MTTTKPDLGFDIAKALASRLGDAPGSSHRASNVGASEVGYCLRSTVSNRIEGPSHSVKSMGAMTTGSALENESIQLLRAGLNSNWTISNTGSNQSEFFALGAPLFSHPDFILTHKDGTVVVGDVKRPHERTVRKVKDSGLSPVWYDQCQTQIGTARDSGIMAAAGLMFVQANSDPTNYVEEWVEFDPERYEYLKIRAQEILDSVQAKTLPDGEPDRGYCTNCSIKNQCPAFRPSLGTGQSVGTTGLPLDVELDASDMASEIVTLEAKASPLNERLKNLKDRLKETLMPHGPFKGTIGGAEVSLTQTDRSGLDTKKLLKDHPELGNSYSTTTTIVTLKVTAKTEE